MSFLLAERRATREAIKDTRAEMRAKGIKRTSCFNGGHSPESYRLNAKMFELETYLAKIPLDECGARR